MKRKITVSDLREYSFCNVSWCIAHNVGNFAKEHVSKKEKKLLAKNNKISEKNMKRGNIAHIKYEFKRVFWQIIYFAITGVLLWLLLSVILKIF